jgi:tripartite-type tricarboxylate transporter receptor subunit TctC
MSKRMLVVEEILQLFGEAAVKRSRRIVLGLAGSAAALTALPRFALALDYPARPVHLVVGFAAGLSPDILGRLIGQSVSERLGQQFIIDNRPGAASNIGTEVVAHATPDGYTVLLTISGNAINATLYTHLNFDFARDLTPVAAIGRTPFVIVVNPSFPVKSVPELIDYAKANPGKINIASVGPGTGPHVACELFKMMTGVDMVQVPYKGSYMTDLLGGQIPIAFSPIAQIIEDVRAGKLTAIGVTTPTRSDAAPQIPAIAEFVPGYAASGWYGICAPTGTPGDIIEKLNATITECVTDPSLKSRLLNLGVEPTPMSVAEFKKFVAAEIAKYAKVIQFAGIKVE